MILSQLAERLTLLAIVAAAGFLAGWQVNGWRLESNAASEALNVAYARAEAVEIANAEQRRRSEQMAAEDARATAEVNHARQEAARLRACIDRGNGCGLRIKVQPVRCESVPAPGTASGVGDRGGEWAELDADARSAYFALRDRLPVVEQALKTCVSQWPR